MHVVPAAAPEVATPKSAAVEALAVIIGIKNRRMWQSFPPPLISGIGDSSGVLRMTEEEDAAAATTAESDSSSDNGGMRRWRAAACDGGSVRWMRRSSGLVPRVSINLREDLLSSVLCGQVPKALFLKTYIMIKYDT